MDLHAAVEVAVEKMDLHSRVEDQRYFDGFGKTAPTGLAFVEALGHYFYGSKSEWRRYLLVLCCFAFDDTLCACCILSEHHSAVDVPDSPGCAAVALSPVDCAQVLAEITGVTRRAVKSVGSSSPAGLASPGTPSTLPGLSPSHLCDAGSPRTPSHAELINFVSVDLVSARAISRVTGVIEND